MQLIINNKRDFRLTNTKLIHSYAHLNDTNILVKRWQCGEIGSFAEGRTLTGTSESLLVSSISLIILYFFQFSNLGNAFFTYNFYKNLKYCTVSNDAHVFISLLMYLFYLTVLPQSQTMQFVKDVQGSDHGLLPDTILLFTPKIQVISITAWANSLSFFMQSFSGARARVCVCLFV
jgi:hypothetical protein